MFKKLSQAVQDFLHRPARVFIYCLIFAFIALGIEGSLFQLWSLYRENKNLSEQMKEIKAMSADVKFKIQQAKDPKFIEKEARDRFDLVEEDDLVFVFAEDQAN